MSNFARTMRSAAGGLGAVAAALVNGRAAEQSGFEQEQERETKLAQALAQVRNLDASAKLRGAQATKAAEETAVLQRRPGLSDLAAASYAGVDVPTLDAYRTELQTGQAPMVPMGPEAEDGSMGVGTAKFSPETRSRISQALVRLPAMLNTGNDLNPEQYAKALGLFRGMDLGDQVLAGQRTAGAVGEAQAAVNGKALFNSDANGAVLDLFGGRLATDNPMAGASIALRGAQAGAQKANAVQSYAAADNSRANAAKARAEMSDGMGRTGKAPAGYRWGADGMTLEAIPGGPADPNTKGAKLSKPPTEGQAKALMFGTRMAAADEQLAELAQRGATRPGYIKDIAESAGNIIGLGTDTFGGALSDVAGAATNWTQSADQQKVEQAQRDFINALLRKESGAVISPGEFRNAAKQYFPQPGDDAATQRQKAANRRTAIAGLKAEVGEAMAPEFQRILSDSRQTRGAKSANTGGATGSYDAPAGWKIEKVN